MNSHIGSNIASQPSWGNITPQSFWDKADAIQDKTMVEADKIFSYLETAPAPMIREILAQYRYFTVYYIADLALLIARLDDGPMRSFLADILYDELGCGKAKLAHPQLYDDFLKTIGVDVADLDRKALASNVLLLDEARRQLVDARHGSEYAIGLRGMGGECVCQVYIAQLHKSLMQNPYIQENRERIDWRFWDMHVGDHDIEHREKTRALIDSEVVARGGVGLQELGQGYDHSMSQWKEFWSNIFAMQNGDLANDKFKRTVVSSSVNVKVCDGAGCPTKLSLMN
ncbi:iron-containing redox enzyme family protein [Agrobacterium sp. a22-2]|uniref:iron-containing redox enzyme family protein n=1 Tax=Agrobacterium sp. a22-2 TaxID=2283840 RepID=UPI0014470E50|nr:iron-containing redox enzyme family protein [Agrobacterium sp. a22-2]NKN35182.1 iron-containing redox enzyme family protein [Agrobacterium sp. a22-2]